MLKVSLSTDHKALIYLNNQPQLNAEQARWISYINLFNYSIGYREGKTNKVADGLCRQHSSENDDILPERLQIDPILNFLTESKEIQLSQARLQFECLNMVTSIESQLIEQIRTALLKDQLCKKIVNGNFTPSNCRIKFRVNNNIDMANGGYFIPVDHSLRNKLLKQFQKISY